MELLELYKFYNECLIEISRTLMVIAGSVGGACVWFYSKRKKNIIQFFLIIGFLSAFYLFFVACTRYKILGKVIRELSRKSQLEAIMKTAAIFDGKDVLALCGFFMLVYFILICVVCKYKIGSGTEKCAH